MASEAGVLPVEESRIVTQVAPAAGQDAAHRPRSRAASSPTTRSRPSSPARIPTRSGWRARRSCSRTCRRCRRSAPRQRRQPARSPAGLRLHAGRPEDPDGADGDHRPGSRRLDGQRHADLGALRQVEAPLHLFQAELRAGHQPADRLDPRGAGDEPRLLHRAAAEPPRPRRPGHGGSGSKCASRSSPTRTSRRSAPSATWTTTRSSRRRSTSPTPAANGAAGMAGALDALCAAAEVAVHGGNNIIILSDRMVGPDRDCRSRRCSPPPASTIT